MNLRHVDVAIVVAYLSSTLLVGVWCAFRKQDSERFMTAGRSLPGWAVGLSIFGTFVSSITFLGNPGKAFADNWNPFVFALSLPIAAFVAAVWFVPFYRRTGEVSSYQHLERRFGAWARTYAVLCYLATQLARSGTIMYLLALALQPLTGWDVRYIILIAGFIMTIFPLIGGTEAVIWTGVLQSVVLFGGTVAIVARLWIGMPGGSAYILQLAHEHHKFSLGSFEWTWSTATFWVVMIYGLATNLQNFGIDQSYVQRYVTARSTRAASNSVWFGALMYIPLSAGFLLIGTALFAFYAARPEALPSEVAAQPDRVFPHFIRTQLPVGLTGMVIAAICAAATDSVFNSTSTLILCDIYKRYFRPQAGERESMGVLHGSTIAFGAMSTGIAIALIGVPRALDAWWTLARIFGGGMLGLFLLGRTRRRAGPMSAVCGVAAGLAVIVWMTASKKWGWLPANMRSRLHDFLILPLGTVTILAVGWVVSIFEPRERIVAVEGISSPTPIGIGFDIVAARDDRPQ